MDIISVAELIVAISALVISLYALYDSHQSQRPDLRITPKWGYYEEKPDTSGRIQRSVYLEFYAKNRGGRGTSVTKVTATVPLVGDVITRAEGSPTEGSVPVFLNAGEGRLLKLRFALASQSELQVSDTVLTPVATQLGFKGRLLRIDFAVVSTEDVEHFPYPLYPQDSTETTTNRAMSTADEL